MLNPAWPRGLRMVQWSFSKGALSVPVLYSCRVGRVRARASLPAGHSGVCLRTKSAQEGRTPKRTGCHRVLKLLFELLVPATSVAMALRFFFYF